MEAETLPEGERFEDLMEYFNSFDDKSLIYRRKGVWDVEGDVDI